MLSGAMSVRIIKPSLPYDLCAHLQNSTQRRMRRVAVPSTGLHFSLLGILLEYGFISSLTRGTSERPDPVGFHTAPISQRRLWLEHKYRDEQPVLRSARLVSKPSLRVYQDRQLLARFLQTQSSLGEIYVVRSIDGKLLWEARHALKHLDQMDSVEVLCRFSS